jgi:rhamnosyltransferase
MSINTPKKMKIAVCIHLYHIDMIDQIKTYLLNIENEYDLFISLVKNYPQSFLNNLLSISKNVKIIQVENKGMDVGAFLNLYKHIDESYDLILKIHTKKSLGSESHYSFHRQKHGYESAQQYGQNWFNDLMSGVLGDSNKVKRIINEFETNPECGMVGNRITQNFKKNIGEMDKIFNILNVENNFNYSNFIGGTIFWVRNSIFKKYFTHKTIESIMDTLPFGYIVEPSPNHALERIFGCLVYLENKKILRIV